ncbi:tail assembly chaperone E/41/14-like protein [Kushneria sinocarnis]|uniref:Tail assembly chaperone E/41/14-like protein n=1 Tax=Kushneria sinocarnis TaxID=595502 RepID=A0A420WVK2_9GAMM|nr:phage tail assembly protein [Kushneria sinocarnis]RKR02583.1 tail assembly chaperone E/41/14-like protein [Kushneria sinocarnis]
MSNQQETPDYLEYADDGSHVVITLVRPASIAGVEQSALQMREPTVEDQIVASEMKGSDATREVAMFANLCEVSPDDIRRLPMKSFRRVQEAYAGFLE